ncbi:MAG: hypothetical protein M1827_001614 [Pycnora praestabilis]|nr:MAG: hypothetical protein M1827_001614 [Pycnora praestabilis]
MASSGRAINDSYWGDFPIEYRPLNYPDTTPISYTQQRTGRCYLEPPGPANGRLRTFVSSLKRSHSQGDAERDTQGGLRCRNPNNVHTTPGERAAAPSSSNHFAHFHRPSHLVWVPSQHQWQRTLDFSPPPSAQTQLNQKPIEAPERQREAYLFSLAIQTVDSDVRFRTHTRSVSTNDLYGRYEDGDESQTGPPPPDYMESQREAAARRQRDEGQWNYVAWRRNQTWPDWERY